MCFFRIRRGGFQTRPYQCDDSMDVVWHDDMIIQFIFLEFPKTSHPVCRHTVLVNPLIKRHNPRAHKPHLENILNPFAMSTVICKPKPGEENLSITDFICRLQGF